jgi:hypothetical protein
VDQARGAKDGGEAGEWAGKRSGGIYSHEIFRDSRGEMLAKAKAKRKD